MLCPVIKWGGDDLSGAAYTHLTCKERIVLY